MTSDQVLTVLTKRMEDALTKVNEVVNLEFDNHRRVRLGDHRP